MLRRNKKRDDNNGQDIMPTSPGLPPYMRTESPALTDSNYGSSPSGSNSLYMQGSAPNSSSSNLTSGRSQQQQQQQTQPQQYAPHHHHNPQQRPIAPEVASYPAMRGNPAYHPNMSNAQNRSIPASASIDAMGPPPQPGYHHQTNNSQSSSGNAVSTPMGRSQSAFNFIISKAKGTFSSGSNQHPQHQQASHPMSNPAMNASSSLNSIYSAGGSAQPQVEEQSRLDTSRTRNRAASSSSSMYTPIPPPVDRTSADINTGGRYGTTSRPSFGDEYAMPASSPTKKSIFGRERKASNNSINRPDRGNLFAAGARQAFTHSPLSRRQDPQPTTNSSNTVFSPFSKSQSDLHSKQDFPSPASGTVELPTVVSHPAQNRANAQNPYNAGDVNLLRSPSPNVAFSRSVDDLSRGHTPPPPISPTAFTSHGTPAVDNDQNYTQGESTWGEHGVAASASDRVRASDVGTLKQEKRRGGQNVGMGLSNVPLAPSISASSSMNLAGWPNAGPTQTGTRYESSRHQRKSSKTMGNVQTARPQANLQRPAFAPGTQYDGLLNRNTQISMSVNQLSEGGGGLRGGVREKDISKGWKPYRVTLQDGKLFFFKPQSSIADDVKALFPSSIVAETYESQENSSRGALPETSRETPLNADGLHGLSVDDIQRNKLGTKDLLVATSGSGNSNDQPARPMPRRNATNESRLSAILDAVEPDPTTPTSASWERKGRHENLVLTSTREIPATWAERISGGSVDALSHEYVFASQANGVTTAQENGVFLFAILITLRRTSRPLQGFLVAVHKWATAVTRGTSAEGDDARSAKEELEKNIHSRLSFLVDAGIAQFADEQARSSVLLMLEDIVRDIVMFGEGEDAINSRITNLRQAVEAVEAPRRSVGDISSNDIPALTTSTLLKMDPSELGRQIHAFYIDHLSKDLLADRLVLPVAGASDNQFTVSNLLSFDPTHPHFLTSLVLEHVLGSEKEDQHERNLLQEAKERAALLRHWIAAASYLIKLQNMSAWVAICAALCSRAVSRLTLTWRFVAATDRMLVSSAWAPALVNLGWSEILDSQIDSMIEATPSVKSSMSGHQNANPLYGFLPYLGNALSRFQTSPPAETTSGVMPISDFRKIAAHLWSVQEVWQSFGTSSKDVNLRPVQVKDDNIQKVLLRLSQSAKSHKTVDHNAPLRLSLKLEPAWLGDEATPGWHPALSKTTSACALSPLSFREPLPNLSLVDPTWIVNTIKRESKDPLSRTLLNANVNDSPDLDGESTITMRSRQRPTLSASPLTRSKAFGAMTGASIRPLHGVPFANIIEWTPGYQAGSGTEELIMRVGSDLVFNVLNEVPSSIPSSPLTSKRFSQEFTRGSRPVSIASKRSSLPPSERNSLVDPIAAPLQVVVKAATLERLVDILVMDVQHLSASLASDEVLEKVILANKRSRISIDIGNYRKVFLATFRVHCKPIVLFDYLRKRLLAAVNAGAEMALPLPHRPNYPTWSRVEAVNSPTQQVDWDMVSRIRQGVTSVLSQWINTYPQDFVEDPQLFESVDALSKEVASAHEKQSTQDEGDHVKLQIALKDIMRQMRLSSMTSQTEKKTAKRSSKRVSNKGTSSATNTPRLDESAKTERSAEFDIDQSSAHDLVEYLESVIKVFFEKIEERDLLVVYDSFYRQSHDPLTWHVSSSQQGAQHNADELPPVNNMYKLLELARWPPRDSQSVYHRLPASIRDACASQNLLRGWCAVHVIEPRIGLFKRQERITKLIDAVWICRARMCNSRMEEMSSSPLSPAFVYQEPTIASFVESVLVGALTSSESRLFIRAWQQVAVERSGNCDSLASLVPPREIADKYRESSQLSSTLDIGWLLKSMAQAVLRVSDVNQEESTLIDFEKQRTIWTLIESSAGRVKSGMIDHSLVDLAGARLSVIQATLRRVQWDRRAFKEDNAAESASISPVPESLRIMRGTRPLTGLMNVQQDKLKRDRLAFDILSIQLEQANQRNAAHRALQSGNSGFGRQPLQSNNTHNSPNFGPSLVPNPASASEKKTRRMTALFRGAVRPIGLMSTSGNERSTTQEMPTRPFAELLPAIPTQKPSSTVFCGSGRISIWRNGQRSFVMNFSPPEGGHILLQAHNAAELQGWCTAIERASKEFASSMMNAPQRQNTGGSTPKSSKGPAFPLYGTDLKLLAESEGQSVPLALSRMMEQVEKRGLREQGIYRISGAKSAIEALKVAFNTQPAQSVNLVHGETSDVHTIAGAIKQWFRDLPEPVIPFKSYHALISAERLENEEERLYAIRDIIWDFPRAHFELLKRVSEHLSLVCQEGQYNLMAPHNIGLVFGTSLLNPPPGPASVAESFGNIGKAAHIVKILVTMHEWLFEPEQEAEAEVPVESPSEDQPPSIKQEEKEVDTADTDLEKNFKGDTGRVANEHLDSQTHELIVDSHHGAEEELAVTQDHADMQDTSFEAVDEEVEELGESEIARSQWIHNPLVTVTDGTVDSHTSDSSIMRAVLGVNSSTSMPKVSTGSDSTDTVMQKQPKEQSASLAAIPTVEVDEPKSQDMSRTNSSNQQEFLDVQEDLTSQSTARQHTRSTSNNVGRDRVVESVYLDATDAIAVLQNPFEEEEEEGGEAKLSDD
ncbi:uncharacterized protein FA14DRAFT_33117 [Meira miltonrushii]|uniref:Ras GEF n=1 Tax=Meira miltonrushii TaxID=1280837 RepID=A0A316VB20_9BASI|nr:uncharacterized protein FA14DRAFT_33117 [Meira miltonrushii]PWN34706.1 hypothetical protein FA14DRAFT_33117 [Meira miltonrushii]